MYMYPQIVTSWGAYKQNIFSACNILFYPTLKVVAPPLIAKVRVRLPVTSPPKILAAP